MKRVVYGRKIKLIDKIKYICFFYPSHQTFFDVFNFFYKNMPDLYDL